MIDSFPRPEVSAEEYREAEMLAMQLLLQLPNQDIGKCLIVFDLLRIHLNRWLKDERLIVHRPRPPVPAEASRGNTIRLVRD